MSNYRRRDAVALACDGGGGGDGGGAAGVPSGWRLAEIAARDLEFGILITVVGMGRDAHARIS